jgi:hypothetical protein
MRWVELPRRFDAQEEQAGGLTLCFWLAKYQFIQSNDISQLEVRRGVTAVLTRACLEVCSFVQGKSSESDKLLV